MKQFVREGQFFVSTVKTTILMLNSTDMNKCVVQELNLVHSVID